MGNKIFGAIDTAGGGDGALDSIIQSTLTDGDMAIAIDASEFAYLYRYESSFDTSVATGTPETDPQVIVPAEQAGDLGAWILADLGVENLKVYGNSVLDGTLLATGLISATAGIDIDGTLQFDGAGPAIDTILTDIDIVHADDTTLASAKSVKTYVDAAALGWTASYVPIRGLVHRAEFTWVDTTDITIGACRYHLRGDDQGEGVHFIDTSVTFTFSGVGTSEWQYLYIDSSTLSDNGATELVAANFRNSSSAPTFDTTYNGWYDDATGDRCIFAVYIDSGGDVSSFLHDGDNYIAHGESVALVSQGYPGTGFSSSTTLRSPSFSTKAKCFWYVYPDNTAAAYSVYVRPTGSGLTNGQRVAYGARFGSSDEKLVTNSSEATTFCSTSQGVDYKVTVADGNCRMAMAQNGWHIPRGM